MECKNEILHFEKIIILLELQRSYINSVFSEYFRFIRLFLRLNVKNIFLSDAFYKIR